MTEHSQNNHDRYSHGPKFPSLGMSDSTAKKVLNFLDLNYSFLQNFFARTVFLSFIFGLGVLLGEIIWVGPFNANKVTLSPLDYIPATFMSYSMWMMIDTVYRLFDKSKATSADQLDV